MSDIEARLRSIGAERQKTTAHDLPDHYLHVVAKISQADGLLMVDAANHIAELTEEIASDIDSILTLREDLERARLDALEEAAREAALEWAATMDDAASCVASTIVRNIRALKNKP